MFELLPSYGSAHFTHGPNFVKLRDDENLWPNITISDDEAEGEARPPAAELTGRSGAGSSVPENAVPRDLR